MAESRPFLASAYRIRRFVREHALADRPHTSLWLAKTYVIPADIYGSHQVWGTVFLQAGRKFSSPLSTLHLHFLKDTLGVKQSTTNWAVLRECGHEPLQFYWFRSAVKLFNSMLNTNCDTLRRVVQADLNLQPRSSACWTAQFLSAFQGLCGCELYVRAVQTGHAITMLEFTANLKHRMRGVWRGAELVDPNTQQQTGHLSLLVCHPFF